MGRSLYEKHKKKTTPLSPIKYFYIWILVYNYTVYVMWQSFHMFIQE